MANGKVATNCAPSRTDAEAAQLKLAALLLSRDKATKALQIIEKLGTNADPDVLCLKGRCLSALDNRAGVRLIPLPTFHLLIGKHLPNDQSSASC